MPATLVIETSTPSASIALVLEDGSIEQREFTSDRNHNALLFEPLRDLLESHGRPRLDRVLIGSGPGSYSGTRVGIAAAQGIGLALGCPAIALPSILAVPSAEGGKTCLAIGDARRGSFWHCQMQGHQLVKPPQLGDSDTLQLAVEQAVQNGTPIIAFEAAERFPIASELQQAISMEFPDAGKLWKVWLASSPEQQQAWQKQIAQPIYLKPPHITPGKRPRLIE